MAQSISGQIFDHKTREPIPFANIYFNNSSNGTTSDVNGLFRLEISNNPGQDIVISSVGYQTQLLQDFEPGNFYKIYLKEHITLLEDVEVVAIGDRLQKRLLRTFFKEFLGDTRNARQCVIQNLEDVEFVYSEDMDSLYAYSLQPLMIANEALGYIITYHLDHFIHVNNQTRYQGYAFFREDTTLNESELRAVRRRRKTTYKYSRMEFFRLLWKDELKQSEYYVYDPELLKHVDLQEAIENQKAEIKYLYYPNTLRINIGDRNSRIRSSYITFIENKRTGFTSNGYFDGGGLIWNGLMSDKRIGDLLPYEYDTETNIIPSGTIVQFNEGFEPEDDNYTEKIYLQLDGNVYAKGDIVWFKSIALKAVDHTPSTLSGVLYVELIASDETIMDKKLIKLDNGIGQGFFELYSSYPDGTYLIRAYTNWNKNFGNDFFFKEYIRIINNEDSPEPISDVKLVKSEETSSTLQANFYPSAIDSLHKNKLRILIRTDEMVDSLDLKRGKDNVYRLDYDFFGNSPLVMLQMQTDNYLKHATSVVLDSSFRDLQFLPESGELVHGLSSKVGFKALNAKGKGFEIQGDIVDENDSLITSFRSNQLGMGSFLIDNPDSTKKYYARLKDDPSVLYSLPEVAAIGNTLSVENNDENVVLTARSNYLKYDSIYLNVACRGKRLFQIKAGLSHGTFKLRIPSWKLPDGIISFTLQDRALRPVAERIYFNENPESRIHINLSADKKVYNKRDRTQITIETTDVDGEPIPANISLLVINKQQMGEIQHRRQNISSYFLLDSELSGELENPGFYFQSDSNMHAHIDALMLTQGWRKYNYSKTYEERTFLPEAHLRLSGRVTGALFNQTKGETNLTLMTFGEHPWAYNQITDSLGKFDFELRDEFGQYMDVMIQSTGSSGEKENYSINLNSEKSPPVDFSISKTIQEKDSATSLLVEKNLERQKVENSFSLDTGSILLDEIEVTSYQMTPIREAVMKEYGPADIVIEGKTIQQKEEKWSFGIYIILRAHFMDKVRVFRTRGGNLHAEARNAEPTLFIVDNIPVMPVEFENLQHIPASEVSSVEVIEMAENFPGLYCKVFPGLCQNAPSAGNVLAIYTHAGNGLAGANKPVGIVNTSVPVFAVPREFYAPKYENAESMTIRKPDLRALIHWEPELQTDHLGSTSASYYNSDIPGKVMVVVEAVSASGAIGYQEIEYEVRGGEILILER